MLKYQHIFNAKQEFYLQKSSNGLKNSKFRNEWAIFAVAFSNPHGTADELLAELNNKYSIAIDKNELVSTLMKRRMYRTDGREKMIDLSKRFASNLFSLLYTGSESAFDSMDEFCAKDYDEHYSKMVLTWLYLFDDNFKSSIGLSIVQNCGDVYCSQFIRSILSGVGDEIGKRRKPVHGRKLNETTAIFNVHTISTNETMVDKDQQIANLKFDLNNYKNALETAQAMFDDLKEEIEASANEAKESAVTEFFVQMNSSKYGNILDNLINVEKALKNIRKQRIQMPPQIAPLTIIFSQLIRFISDSNLTQIDIVDREFNSDCFGIDSFNFIGNPYKDESEVKKLKVVTPGWKYDNSIIALPTIKEVVEHEED